MPTVSDFLETTTNGFLVPAGNLWVRFHNNDTAVDYYSTSTTNASTGIYTINSIPAGSYTVYTGLAATVPGTSNLADANYIVPYGPGDAIVGSSFTAKLNGPYTPDSSTAHGAEFVLGTQYKIFRPPSGGDDAADLNLVAGTADVLTLPPGRFLLSSAPFKPPDKLTLQGSGRKATILVPSGTGVANKDGIRIAQASGAYYHSFTMRDLGLDCTSQAAGGDGVYAIGCDFFTMEHVDILSPNTFGLYLGSISAGSVLGLGTQIKQPTIRDCYVYAAGSNDSFGGGGITGGVWDHCFAENPSTNGFDYTNINDSDFDHCRVYAPSGTPNGFASDFGAQDLNYTDCKAYGSGIQNGFSITDDSGNANAQGHAFRIAYKGCKVVSITNLPWWLKSNGVGQHVDLVALADCIIDSTGASGLYAQGTSRLAIAGTIFKVGAAQFAISLDSDSGGATACSDVRLDASNDWEGSKGVQLIAAPTGTNSYYGVPRGASSNSFPGNPVGTASGAGVMMGLAGAITPVRSGIVLFLISGSIWNPTAIGDGARTQIKYGTGAAPVNGAASTGTAASQLNEWVTPTAAAKGGFAVQGIVSGLTLGTAYWYDLLLAATVAGTATVGDLTLSAIEL